ncbi:MAG: pantoate--beta-alanine ligase [Nitrospirae bacterium]|nr:pantoate--beta-alanine ligase [Nitrospirota bacterium]
MEIIRTPRIMRDTSKGHILRGKNIGFVPTMGSLHEGHLSLVRRARQENDIAVVSIFVNPVQFGPSEDFNRYPRDVEGDTEKLVKEDIDILFMPDITAMYTEDFSTYVEVEKISEKLCGVFRPGHFKGVTTVVAKLFNIVTPTRAYFGQKDYQQCVVIKKLVKDLDMDIYIVVCPTIREKDGLAMSSRNAYLDSTQRAASTVIYRCLTEASEMIKSGIIDFGHIKKVMHERISKEPVVSGIDYVGIYDPSTLDELSGIKDEVLPAAAIWIGNTRLIDNMLVKT